MEEVLYHRNRFQPLSLSLFLSLFVRVKREGLEDGISAENYSIKSYHSIVVPTRTRRGPKNRKEITHKVIQRTVPD